MRNRTLAKRASASDLGVTVLFGWAAECLTTCFVPEMVSMTGINVASLLLNVLGAALGGFALSIEETGINGSYSVSTRRLATLFRGGFVGVLTVRTIAIYVFMLVRISLSTFLA